VSSQLWRREKPLALLKTDEKSGAASSLVSIPTMLPQDFIIRVYQLSGRICCLHLP